LVNIKINETKVSRNESTSYIISVSMWNFVAATLDFSYVQQKIIFQNLIGCVLKKTWC